METPRKLKKKIVIQTKMSGLLCNERLSHSYTPLDRSRCQVLRQEIACSDQPLSLPGPQHLCVQKFLLIACQAASTAATAHGPGVRRAAGQGCLLLSRPPASASPPPADKWREKRLKKEK